ncbi:ribonuclease HI [Brevibacterium album]|uniref:ribonuclease HI n=1 Tax=Brevibacterium album TaxID=417948 RepID=UPI000688E8DA|nr:RNase H family protein [Brevibacterium album]
MTSSALRIGTDGAARKNPGPAGWAWVDEHGRYAAGSWTRQTNNVAELTGIRHALADHPDTPLVIESDSQYAINCLTRWARGWRKNPAKAEGKKNLDLIYGILDLIDARSHPVTFEWVRGHDETNAHPLNTAADLLSARFADSRSDQPYVTGMHEIDWERKEGNAAAEAHSGSGSRSRGGASGAGGAKAARKRKGPWATQTEIGRELGLSSIAMGKKLEALGLRADRQATQAALDAGLAKERRMKTGTTFYVWHSAKVLERVGEGSRG